MRGDTGRILVLTCLAALATARTEAQPGIIIDQQIGNPTILLAPAQPAGATIVPPSDEGDLLQFVDGSLLHGGLNQMDTTSGLRWESPAAKNPIDLLPTRVDMIRFAHATSVTLAPTSRLRLANGDDLLGMVVSLDNERLGFGTWFGKALSIPRAAVQSITFLSSNYSVIYEGPSEIDGWVMGSHNPESWTLHDGAFISGSPGPLGRDFKLTGSSTIEFDVSWNDLFQLMVCIYSDAVDRLDYGNSYLLEFTRNEVDLRHVDSNRQYPLRNFGAAPIPYTPGKSKMHVTIQSNKDEGTVTVYIDNVLVKRWKDEGGFTPAGGGLLFQQQEPAGAVIKLSNIKVSQWEGHYEPETAALATNVDAIRFINRDHAAGKITSISDGKVTLDFNGTPLQIPIQRVTQINFAATPAPTPPRGPWEVRAHFPGGGTLSFQLQKWSGKEVVGQSAVFGPVAFLPNQIRQLEFNLDHPTTTTAPAVIGDEFEGLDE